MVKENVVESILMDNDEEENLPTVNTLQDTIRELGRQINNTDIKRKSNLTNENVLGITQAECLNEYMQRNFGYRYASLDALVENKRDYAISYKGYGIEKMIEIVKSIQASFEQTQLPENMRKIIGR